MFKLSTFGHFPCKNKKTIVTLQRLNRFNNKTDL